MSIKENSELFKEVVDDMLKQRKKTRKKKKKEMKIAIKSAIGIAISMIISYLMCLFFNLEKNGWDGMDKVIFLLWSFVIFLLYKNKKTIKDIFII